MSDRIGRLPKDMIITGSMQEVRQEAVRRLAPFVSGPPMYLQLGPEEVAAVAALVVDAVTRDAVEDAVIGGAS